ncbi:MAG: ATP-binding cassette domain-containing protein [Alkalispirochaeta sp.]
MNGAAHGSALDQMIDRTTDRAIEVSDLSFTYPEAKVETLHGFSFSVRRGEIFGFLGPSGAGKSTTQNILIGLLRDYQGSVRVGGQEIRHARPSFYERIGVAFEFPAFYSRFTALENLQYFASMYRGETRSPSHLLELFGLTDAAHRRVSAYSKGMKTRLNLCRALINNPDVLFLDEPTTGLDPTTARRVMTVIDGERRAGTTVFLTTHNMHVADELCDRVAFMVDGSLPVIDAPATLRDRYGSPSVVVTYDTPPENEEFPLQDLADNPKFLARLRKRSIRRIHSQEASLEDVFTATTGRGLT